MKVPGLSGKAPAVETPQWYLLEAKVARFRDRERKGARLEVDFQITDGKFHGEAFVEKFFLSIAALSRLKTFLSRGGYPKELIEADDVDEDKIAGLRVWALVDKKEENGNEVLAVDGWNFRSESDPPSEAQGRDYAAQDAELAEGSAMEGLE